MVCTAIKPAEQLLRLERMTSDGERRKMVTETHLAGAMCTTTYACDH